MKYRFKVKYGFAPSEFVSIEAGPELEKAIYAKIEKIPVTLGGKFIDGKTILRIEPNVNKYTGWYDNYEPTTAEDYAQIKRDYPKELDEIISTHTAFVNNAIQNNLHHIVGSGKAMTMILPEKTEVSNLTEGLANKMKQYGDNKN